MKFKSKQSTEKDDVPFGVACPLFVLVPFHWAVEDGYIDDIITIIPAYADWVPKGQNIAPLVVHTIFRPTNDSDPLPRADATSIPKIDGEGTPDENKIVLGCLLNTRLFRIFLPYLKAKD